MSKLVYMAMSGGVDSSLGACLLLKAGYEVSGIHLELSAHPGLSPEKEHADLENTCRQLNIPLHYLHLESEFEQQVINYFCEEYRRGRTPNPCVQCNKFFKFGLLLDKVREMGGQFLATGHYARIEESAAEFRLLKGLDPRKDQSYFLYRLGQRELSQVLFPVGGMLKTEVKKMAADLGLPASQRQESQDICFIPDNNSRAFLAGRIPPQPGEIVDPDGRVLGHHQGLAFYTIGQRQGMGVSSTEPLYVLRLDSESNRLVIGPQSLLFKNKIRVHDLNWTSGPLPSGEIDVMAKVRYRSPEARAVLSVRENQTEVRFIEPQRAIAPGQSVVFYEKDRVLGGGIIGETA